MDAFMCYGPVVPDGYGCCYNPHPNSILVCISSFKSHTETRSDYFAFTLEGSFLQMHELCLKASEPPPVRNSPRVRSLERNGTSQEHRNGSASPRKSRLVRQKQTDNHPPEQNGWLCFILKYDFISCGMRTIICICCESSTVNLDIFASIYFCEFKQKTYRFIFVFLIFANSLIT